MWIPLGFHINELKFKKVTIPVCFDSFSEIPPGTLQPYQLNPILERLTHWGRVTHICVSDLTIVGSDNGLSPGRRQAIIRTNAGILLIRPLGTNFSEILIKILIFSFKKMRLKVSPAKRRRFCLGLNVLNMTAKLQMVFIIWIDANIDVILGSSTTWEAHHSPRATSEGCLNFPGR